MLVLGGDATIEFLEGKGTVVLRGWRIAEGGYLLTEKPDGYRSPFVPGTEAIVRLMRNGRLYGVAVRFEGILKKTNVCHLSFNQDVVEISLRKLDRISCILPVTMRSNKDGDVPDEGVIVNLSLGGIKIFSHVAVGPTAGEIVSVSFNPGGMGSIVGQKVQIVKAEVVGGRHEFHGHFIETPAHNNKLLESFLQFCKTWTE